MSTHEATPARRGRGIRANLDRASIVEVARSIPSEELTLQAVAEKLGVDRKAVSHHVGDRDTLLELVAIEALSEHFVGVAIPDGDWTVACRAFATMLNDGLISTGYLAEYFRLSGQTGISALEPAETALDRMVEAGIDEPTAARGLAILTNLVISHARNVVMSARFGTHPQRAELRSILDDTSAPKFELLRRLLLAEVDPSDDSTFELSIDIFILGMERVLERAQPSTPLTES